MDLDEKFPHLNNAPIVEAVIDFRVISIGPWDDKALKKKLEKVKNYPKIEESREFKYEIKVGKARQVPEDLGCVGFRLTSRDEHYIAQFNKTGFALSRVKIYEDWEKFCEEVKYLWEIYQKLLKPSGVNRIGVRFINSMLADYKSREFLRYFTDPPKENQVLDWSLENFLHRDIFKVPGTDYGVNLIKTIVSSPTKEEEVSATLDVDAYYNQQTSCDWDELNIHLKAMRWVKNAAFFKSIAEYKIEEFK